MTSTDYEMWMSRGRSYPDIQIRHERSMTFACSDNSRRNMFFYRVMRRHSASYAVARCLSVRPSVTRRYCVKTAKHIIKLFSPSDRYTIRVSPHQTVWQYSDGDLPDGGVECRGGMKKALFSINIPLYLGNDTRKGHNYYGTPIGTRTQPVKWCYFQWPWVILSDLAKYSTTQSTVRPLSDSWASCLKTVIKQCSVKGRFKTAHTDWLTNILKFVRRRLESTVERCSVGC